LRSRRRGTFESFFRCSFFELNPLLLHEGFIGRLLLAQWWLLFQSGQPSRAAKYGSSLTSRSLHAFDSSNCHLVFRVPLSSFTCLSRFHQFSHHCSGDNE
jgi:hypothetical protein